MKNTLFYGATLIMALTFSACGSKPEETSQLNAVDNKRYPLCPADPGRYGGQNWRPGNPQVSANGMYFFWWFKSLDFNRARALCDVTPHTAGQLRANGGCSCLVRR